MKRSDGVVGPRRFGAGAKAGFATAVLVLVVIFAVALAPRQASGDEKTNSAEPLGPTAAQTRELLESGTAQPLVEEAQTDFHAAQTMPHRDLERGEALELAEEVFGAELEAGSGIYKELEPEKFLSNYSAVVPAASIPEESAQGGEGLPAEHPNQPVVLESTLPLRTENSSGEEEPVSLELERSEGELQPQNPLTEVGIPDRVGEGITLDGAEVEVTVAGAPEDRVATNAEGEFAFYPEVAEDTDLIAEPTPRGVEAYTDIRSAEAPTTTTYELSLPEGAELRPTEEGGAEVVENDHVAVLIPPPNSTDAAGNPVETKLVVSGDAVSVEVDPNVSTAFPVLVDPYFVEESWRWTWEHMSEAAWNGTSTNWYAMEPLPYAAWEPSLPGLDVTSAAWGGTAAVGTHADWEYWVPRYREEVTHGNPAPTTWVYSMASEGVFFRNYGNTSYYPALVLGLINPQFGWADDGVHYGVEGEMTNWNNFFQFTNKYEETGTKGADLNLVTYETEYTPKRRDAYLSDAYIWLVDEDAPTVTNLTPPTGWYNSASVPLTYSAEDKGLGMRGVTLTFGGTVVGLNGFGSCASVENPCPRIATSTTLPVSINTSLLPTGVDEVNAGVYDPLAVSAVAGHQTNGTVRIKVDHTGPEVSLSGPLTELAGYRPRELRPSGRRQGRLGSRSPVRDQEGRSQGRREKGHPARRSRMGTELPDPELQGLRRMGDELRGIRRRRA